MVDAHSIADDQVRSAFQRWQNLEEEKARVADDLKELFAEQKALGHDTKAMRAAFRLKVKLDEADPAEAEHEALVDTYLAALEAPRASRAYAREKTDKFGSIKLMNEQLEAARRSDAGLNIVTKHTEIAASVGSPAVLSSLTTREAEESVVPHSPETANETHERPSTNDEPSPEAGPQAEASPAGTGTGTLADREGRSNGEAVSADLPTISDQPLKGGDEAPKVGGVPTSKTGEGAASALPANSGVTLEYVPSSGVKRLPFASCFPELSKSDYERLEKDIAANRVQTPIIRQGDVIIDGWARYTISRTYGFAYPVEELHPGRDVLLDVIEMQRASRDFTPAQERKIAADLAKEFPRRADEIMTAFGLVEALEAAE